MFMFCLERNPKCDNSYLQCNDLTCPDGTKLNLSDIPIAGSCLETAIPSLRFSTESYRISLRTLLSIK